jgi:Rho-type GTPase-activating protein 1/2
MFDEDVALPELLKRVADISMMDSTILTDAIQKYLLKLPEPIVPFQYLDELLEIIKENTYEEEKLEKCKKTIMMFPEVNHNTLQFLLMFFAKIDSEKEYNKTDSKKLAEGKNYKNKKSIGTLYVSRKRRKYNWK